MDGSLHSASASASASAIAIIITLRSQHEHTRRNANHAGHEWAKMVVVTFLSPLSPK
jgi:hypothetical protein